MLRVTVWIASLTLAAGCSTYKHPVLPLNDDARAALSTIALETRSDELAASFHPPSSPGKSSAARDAVGAIAARTLGPCEGCHPYSGLIIIPMLVVGGPVAAAAAAIRTPRQDDLDKATGALKSATHVAKWERVLRERVSAALRVSGRPMYDPTAESRLDLTIEGARLAIRDYDGVPVIRVRGRVERRNTFILDRHWQWNGESDDYVDLGDDAAKDYMAQMEKGVSELANAIVAELFISKEPRLAEYRSEDHFIHGYVPLAIFEPEDYQNHIVSWDNRDFELVEGVACAIPDAGGDSTNPTASGPPW
jgi:hypothetical protein